ncbi:hypothetical protein EDB80DRAFT_749550 [Ilyonectria destructans]|nr:hypothetical protein EDB80DRAFT_749550 [Ilyonectria destructans]
MGINRFAGATRRRHSIQVDGPQALLRRVVDIKSRDEAQVIIEGYFPECREDAKVFLKTKEGPPVQLYMPDFKLLPWYLLRSRPSSLVLIGLPYCGKTMLALMFGRPGLITDRWDVDKLLRPGITYLNGEGKNIVFRRPIIWVYTPEINPLNNPEIELYMRDSSSSVVIVKIKNKLYR